MDSPSIDRRTFLLAGGAMVVSFASGASTNAAAAVAAKGHVAPKSLSLSEVDGFLAIGADGRVTVYSGKVDLGTGVRTALMQIAAEELDTPLERIDVVQGDTLLTPDQGATISSVSISRGGVEVRRAAATARAALIEESARRWTLPAASLSTQAGAVVAADGRRLAYGELIGGRQFALKVDAKVRTKDPATYTVVGKPVPRVDIPAIVTGRFEFMHDFRLPGMLHARVVRPPTMRGRLGEVDDSAAKRIPGYVATVRHGNFLAVVARDEWASIRAARALRAEWANWEGLPAMDRLWDEVRRTPVLRDEVTQNVGKAPEVVEKAARTLRATFDFAIHTHGSIGPSCAVAQWTDGNLHCWSASQQTHELRRQLADMFSLPAEQVRCSYIEGSGCYGRNGHEDAAADAALIARSFKQPVRVQWSRADEHVWDPKGPPTLIDYVAALDSLGNVVAWSSEAWIPAGQSVSRATLVAAEHAGMPVDASHPGSVQNHLAIQYRFPNIRSVAHRLAHTPFRPSWIRTPGRMQNTFGNEVFIDELAHATGVDPLMFRIRALDDRRGVEALERVAKLAAWQPRGGPNARGGGSGDVLRGRGVSYVKYELVRTYVAAVAEVEVNRKTGHVRVTRFFVAHDCGQIINPDGLKNQIEGNVVQTASRALFEELRFDRSTVTSRDWATYPILRFPDAPDVVIDLIDRPREAPWGAGEPTAAVVPSAISNAIFDATGVRMRSVPFTPAKLLEGLRRV
ncbi:MAG: molybdopterin cofactor-binding domain-containing protein [bacterium]|nr:molybdopterin-dependent oxidoreductase [Betaproteobacteria bacterium]